MLLRVLAGDTALLEKWQWFGGAECLLSYGLNPNELVKASNDVALAMVRSAIPVEHVRFIRSFWDAWSFGDYLFVHAGVRPGIELEQQRQSDLRWIRDPFLSDESDLGFFVVHGHTITTSVEQRRNRIGIDTGAYRTGILTALAIEGTERWLLQTNIE